MVGITFMVGIVFMVGIAFLVGISFLNDAGWHLGIVTSLRPGEGMFNLSWGRRFRPDTQTLTL